MLRQSPVKILPLLLLAALAATSWWIENMVSKSAPVVKRTQRHDPDYIMEGLHTRTLDQAGQLKQAMTADRMTHYPDDDSTVIDQAFIQVFEESKEIWNIRSAKALSRQAGQDILLKGDVNINRLATPNQGDVKIVTRNVHILSEREFAQTDEPISITDATGQTQAVGMRLYMDQQKLQLLSKVRGTYESHR